MSAPRAHPLSGGYDQSLLAETPEVSRAAKQEGYNVNLLEQDPRTMRATSTPRNDPQAVAPKEQYHSLGPGPGRMRVPFWKTRGGMITLAVLAIVIVGAVVGGAVGGTVGKTSSNNESRTSSSSASSSSTSSRPATQAQGTPSTTTTPPPTTTQNTASGTP